VLIRSLATVFIVASSFILVTGQTPDAKRVNGDKASEKARGIQTEKLQDLPFPAGVNLAFLVKELAREMDLNVVFDTESRLESRSVRIELKNVTVPAALDYILLQEGLYSEEIGPKTILVASRVRGTSIQQPGPGLTPSTLQQSQNFRVDG